MSLFSKKIVGIDIHDYSAQAVELRKKGKRVSLEAYNRIIIPEGIIKDGEILKEEDLKNLIVKLLKEANPKPIEADKAAIVFPSSKVFTHIFKFPITLEDAEIKESLPFEAERIIPFSIQDVYWDCTILDKDDPKVHHHASKFVLFSAIPKEIADRYVQMLNSLGLAPHLFGVEIESLKYGLAKQMEPDTTNLLIDIGSLTVNYLISKNDKIKYFFSSNKGGKSLINMLVKEYQTTESAILQQKEENKFEKRYLPQLNMFIADTYKVAKKIAQETEIKPEIGKIDSIYLTGEFLNLPNFYEIAKEYFPGKKVLIGDPRKYLIINAEKFKAMDAKKTAYYASTYFVNSVGIALRGIMVKLSNGINLLPDYLKESMSNKRSAIFCSITAIAMCAISLFMATFIFFKHQDLSYERLNLELKKASIDKMLYGTRYQEIKTAVIKFNKEVNELANIESRLFSVPKLFEDINNLIPEGVKITGLKFSDSDLTIELTGIAETREILLSLNQRFRDALFIEEVITPISSFDEKYKISFGIKVRLLFKELAKYGTAADA